MTLSPSAAALESGFITKTTPSSPKEPRDDVQEEEDDHDPTMPA